MISDAHIRNFLSHVIGQEISAEALLIHLHYKLTCAYFFCVELREQNQFR